MTGGISDRTSSIVDQCIKVAASSGGVLGLKLGAKSGDDEKKRIEEILVSLGPARARGPSRTRPHLPR